MATSVVYNLSYLIQNFYYPTSSLRINLRVKSALLARNFLVIYTLFSNSSKLFNTLATSHVSSRYLLKIANIGFRAFVRVLFPKVTLLRYTPIGINFPLSARYRALLNIDYLMQDHGKPQQSLQLTNRFLTNPYFNGIPIAITPIAKKPFAYTFYKMLRMSLNVWFSWPKQFKLLAHYTSINSQWNFLRFLNKYYFKIYNV